MNMDIQRFAELENIYFDNIREEFRKKEEEHKPSGKLSASMLAKPLLWQVLKRLEVEKEEKDIYTLMTFDRGDQVEDLFLKRLPVVERQKEVEFEGVVGKVDAVVEYGGQKLPLEVKSVRYMKFKKIGNEPDDQYLLQASLYGLALKSEYFLLSIVDTQSGTPLIFKVKTKDYERRVLKIKEDYDEVWKRGFMPVFEPLYDWQKYPKYSDYPEFNELKSTEILKLLEVKYPESYKKWKNFTQSRI